MFLWALVLIVTVQSRYCYARYVATCAKGSVAYDFPFCDERLALEVRAKDLVGRLTDQEKLGLFSIASPNGDRYVERLNLKRVAWDSTCIQGLAPIRFHLPIRNMVYPNAIAQGATWDEKLIRAVGMAIAEEAREANMILYNATNGTAHGGIVCDGGPLANMAQDPRWGRISETYGEDPILVSRIGVAATKGLQNMRCNNDNGRCFHQTMQVTRHLLGYHGATPDLPRQGEEVVLDKIYLKEILLKPYRAFQKTGGALGIMCALSTINGVPSCVNDELFAYVLNETNTTIVQTDCCDSISEMVLSHHSFQTFEEAVSHAVRAGVSVSYSYRAPKLNEAFLDAIVHGNLQQSDLDRVAQNVIMARMHLGEFEREEPKFPSLNLDRVALAQKVAAKSMVLLKNKDDLVLPLKVKRSGTKIALLGPFVNCTCPDKATYASNDCYTHSYHGRPLQPRVPSILDVFREIDPAELKVETIYFSVCESPTNCSKQAINDAMNQLKKAQPDYIILGLGLGGSLEAEGRDRNNLELPDGQQDLLTKATSIFKSVIALIHGAGPVTLSTPHLNDLGALMVTWYGGEEYANALRKVLFHENGFEPEGRLPVTIYQPGYLRRLNATIAELDARVSIGRTTKYLREEPQFPFGFGLDYFHNLHTVSFGGEEGNQEDLLKIDWDQKTVTVTVTAQSSVLKTTRTLLLQFYIDKHLQDFKRIKYNLATRLTFRFHANIPLDSGVVHFFHIGRTPPNANYASDDGRTFAVQARKSKTIELM